MNLRFARLAVIATLAVIAASCPAGCQNADTGGADVPGESDASFNDVWPVDWVCLIAEGDHPDYAAKLGCPTDFYALASRSLDNSVSGTSSLKSVVDLADDNALYFQNSDRYGIHWEFCVEHLSGNGKPPVGDLSLFNQTEYYSKYRRFLLGAVTFYAGPGVWAYEIAPYDTSSPEMIATAYDLIREAAFIGDDLYFHPTSESVEALVDDLPDHVKVITSAELFEGIDFIPLNLGEAVGRLRFFHVNMLELGQEFVTPRDIAVLDRVPNDISVVAGIITDDVQTPLSHINVLSQNRGTPNMVLIGAMEDQGLRELEDRWVRLTVDPFDYTVVEVTKAEADAWWEEHKPPPVIVPELDLTVTELRDTGDLTLDDIPAFGGKASHYGVLCNIGDVVPAPKAFAIPVFFYRQFEEQNGFDKEIDALLADDKFNSDISYREYALGHLRDDMEEASVDEGFLSAIMAKLETDYPGVRMRFRSSTNAEDLDGFTGAGLYTSKTGDPNDPDKPVVDAVRTVWASLWNFRAFEERSFRGIDHRQVAMAMLVHRSFPDEDSNGVALTNNIFDPMQPAHYINVQKGEASVVKPPPGVVADQFLYFFLYPGQPMTFFAHSNLVPEGETVLTREQTYRLGQALQEIHWEFAKYYQKPDAFYAMDVEFKFNTDPGDEESQLWVKQARPHPGWSVGTE